MKVNLGSGQAYLPGWVNVDESPDVQADIHLDAHEFVRQYGPQIEEVYLGHVLEHLMPGDALTLLQLLNERLPAGSVVSAVTPDLAAIWDAYRAGEIDSYRLNASFLYSYEQPSHHLWSYDRASLLDLFARAGFADADELDVGTWEPVTHKEGDEARWQVGVRATAAGAPSAAQGVAPDIATLTWQQVQQEAARQEAGRTAPVTADELLVRRIELLRTALTTAHARRVEADAVRASAVEQLREAREDLETAERRAKALAAALPADQLASLDVDLEAAELDADGVPYGTGPKRLPANSPVVPPPPSVRRAVDPDAEPVGGWKSKVRRYVSAKLPEGSTSREVAKAGLDTYRESVEYGRRVKRAWRGRAIAAGKLKPRPISYDAWLAGHLIEPDGIKAQAEWARHTTGPDRDPGPRAARPRRARRDPGQPARAELAVLAGGGVRHRGARPCGYGDARIGHAAVESGSVYDAANASVQAAGDAEFVITLRAGDVLQPDCLFTVASAVHQDPLLELIVWDDDVIGGGARSAPHFRPSWSPEMLLGADYIGGACALRRSAFLAAGGLLDEFGPALRLAPAALAGPRGRAGVPGVPRALVRPPDRPAPDPALAAAVVQRQLNRRGLLATAELVGDVVRVRWTD